MRAAIITRPGKPDVLEIQEVETPEPVGDYVRVRVRASGINRADTVQRAGHHPAPPGWPRTFRGWNLLEKWTRLARSPAPGSRGSA